MIERERLLLLGHPVAQSLSPLMHNAALDAAGIALRYDAMDVAPHALSETLHELALVNCAGNITVPHKRTAMGLMDAVSPPAAAAGAVNSFRSDNDGHIAGHNTDVAGFASLAMETMGGVPDNCRVAVLGSGGAAGAVLVASREWKGCTATVHARSPQRAAELCRRFSGFARAATMTDVAIGQADIVVNATPIGLFDDSQPIDIAYIAPRAVVLDLVYSKTETAWVRNARERGHRASDGLPMLVRQGALSFRWWFGIDPDEDAMWGAVLTATGRNRPS